jgi:hypothetical protein
MYALAALAFHDPIQDRQQISRARTIVFVNVICCTISEYAHKIGLLPSIQINQDIVIVDNISVGRRMFIQVTDHLVADSQSRNSPKISSPDRYNQ